MKGKLFFIFFVFLIGSSYEKDPRFDLPDDLEPNKYFLKLKTDFKTEKRFWGEIVITVTCKKETSEIVLNTKDLEIIEDSVKVKLVSENLEKNIDISKPHMIEKAEQYVIPVTSELVANQKYEIHISFSRAFSHDFNVYQFHSVTDSKTNLKQYYGFTKIGPGQARNLFPLFDQIKFKTDFQMIHDHPKGVTGFSNMPLENVGTSTQGEDWQSDIFEKSIPMSSHTIGFALAELEKKENKDPSSGATISIWADTATLPLTEFLWEMIARILDFYSKLFKVNYPFPKLDILILPQYRGGYDKDTSGLIIFGNSRALDVEIMDINIKTEIAKDMCEAICRQWIGTYTTMSQWNEHWLHRALVHIYSLPCVEDALPQQQWKYSDSLALIASTDVLENDLDKSGHPVYSPDDNIDVSYNDPDSIVSEKAFLLVRMLHSVLGEVVFQNSMVRYIKTYGKGNSNLGQVWEIFTEVANAAKKLPPHTTVEHIMDSWSTKSRYPLFKVERDYQTNIVSITQEPFVLYEEERKDSETGSSNDCWISSLTYKTESGFLDEGRHWFSCTEAKSQIDLKNLPKDKWIIFNLKMSAPCRTLYDYDNWNLLSKTLLDEKKFEEIDDLTRAALLFDMFALARVGKLEKLGYPFVLRTLKYLVFEDSYLVWLVVASELEKLHNNLFRTKIFDSYQKYIREIMSKVFEKSEKKSMDELMLHDPYLKRKSVMFNVSCRFGVPDCETQCLRLYEAWYDNFQSSEESPIREDIRETVMCHAVKNNDKNWRNLLQMYDRSNKLQINNNVFSAMGCSTRHETLKEYLDMILSHNRNIADSDREEIFDSLAWNEDGYPLVKEFLINKYDYIVSRFPGKTDFFDSYLEKLLNATTMKEDLDEITAFMQVIRPKENPEYEAFWKENVTKVDRNIQWYEKNVKELSEFFDKQLSN